MAYRSHVFLVGIGGMELSYGLLIALSATPDSLELWYIVLEADTFGPRLQRQVGVHALCVQHSRWCCGRRSSPPSKTAPFQGPCVLDGG